MQGGWLNYKMTIKEGLTDKMCAGHEDLSVPHKMWSPHPWRGTGIQPLAAVQTISASGPLLKEARGSLPLIDKHLLIFRKDAAIMGPQCRAGYPPGITGSGVPAKKIQPLYLLLGRGSNLDNEKNKGQNSERNT